MWEYVSAGILAAVMVAIGWVMARREQRKEKMDAMIKETQKVCQARLLENKAETPEGE